MLEKLNIADNNLENGSLVILKKGEQGSIGVLQTQPNIKIETLLLLNEGHLNVFGTLENGLYK